jgi:diacylglycerol kinase (ATP)
MPSLLPRVRVILNPNAGGGSALGRVDALGRALAKNDLPHEIVLSRGRGHAAELARAAVGDAVDVIAVAGGDGTLNEVLQAYLDGEGAPSPGPDLSLIPCGAGSDFARTLGLSGAIDEAVGRLRHGARRAIDLGVVHFGSSPGTSFHRAFANVASFGINGAADALASAKGGALSRLVGGRAGFLLSTARAMVTYRNVSMRVRIDGAPFFEGPAFSVAVANGRYFGGGMRIAPHADPSDGRLEVVVLGDLKSSEIMGLVPKIYRGAHLAEPGIRVGSGTRIEAELVHPWATVFADVDGEFPGKLPVVATVHKGALTFRV